ncbi:MAG TPA: hypothetical protein VM733_13260, partial [Thermoanaerobaculia bacterium]|nr:hypothetical protein [Thermoanaerobaculia bacterium]
RVLPLLLFIAAACGSASGNRPADVAKPDIDVQQVGGALFFGSSGLAPVSIEVSIRNNATVPLRVREVELRSPGMMQYTLTRATKTFNETIPPGQSRTVGLVATAYKNNPREVSSEPLTIQAVVRFDVNGRGFREIVMERFAGPGM